MVYIIDIMSDIIEFEGILDGLIIARMVEDQERIKKIHDVDKAAPVVEAETDEICPICMDNLKDKETIRKGASCGHQFCASCLEKWLELHTTCPKCRYDMSKEGGCAIVEQRDRDRDQMYTFHAAWRFSRIYDIRWNHGAML